MTMPSPTVRLVLVLVLLPVLAAAAPGEPAPVVATTYYRTFSHAHPVLKAIKPGTRVNFTIEQGQGGMYEIKAITPAGGGR